MYMYGHRLDASDQFVSMLKCGGQVVTSPYLDHPSTNVCVCVYDIFVCYITQFTHHTKFSNLSGNLNILYKKCYQPSHNIP